MPSFTFEVLYQDVDDVEKSCTVNIEDARDYEEAESFARVRVGAQPQERDPTSGADAAYVKILTISEIADE